MAKQRNQMVTRRAFLRHSAAAVATAYVTPYTIPTSGLGKQQLENVTIFEALPGDSFAYGWVSGAPLLGLFGDGRLAVAVEQLTPRANARSAPCLVSDDDGATWHTIEGVPSGFAQIVDVKRPYMPAELADGTMLDVDIWTWADHPETQRKKLAAEGRYLYDEVQGNRPGVISVFYELWMGRSRDGGKSWSITELNPPNLINWSQAWRYGEPLVLRDGTFIKPFWGKYGREAPNLFCSAVLRSEDGGNSWTYHILLRDKNLAFSYSCMTEAVNGDLIAVVQPAVQDRLWTTISSDGGKTWSKAMEQPIRGGNPWIITTTEGLLVLIYAREYPGRYPEGTGVFVCVSQDHGQTWKTNREMTVWNNKGKGILTMPTAIAMPDGSVYAVYALQSRILTGSRFTPI